MDLTYLILFILLVGPFESLWIEESDESDLLRVCADERVLKQLKKEALLVSKLSVQLDEKYRYLPLSVDWRDKGAVSTIKHQRQCGSCWAFSAIGAVEGIHKIQSHKLLNLSAQQLVDWDRRNRGSKSGNMGPAFEYITKHGIATQVDYPYTGKAGHCNTHVSTHRLIAAAVVRQPISAYIAMDENAIWEYKGGIFKGPCGTGLNHGILVVGYGTTSQREKYWIVKNSWGYGTTSQREKYWIVKNSWGRKWGEGGFMLMERDIGEKGLCDIASLASYPIPVQH